MSFVPVTRAIKEALQARFAAPEWACFFEVPQGTGGSAGRNADAVAMNMYPSRGLRVHGVEVKASRSDWLRELKNPAKAEAIARFCDHWWIAAAPNIVRIDELPHTWGLLELHGKSLRQRVAAPLLDAEPLTRPFIASLLRCAAGRAARELYDQTQKATAAARDQVDERVAREVQSSTAAHQALREKVAEFEAASGLEIAKGWRGGESVGIAVRLVQELGLTTVHGTARNLVDQARRFVERADDLLAGLPGPGSLFGDDS